MELFRDESAEQYERHIGSAWRPRSGSKVDHRALTSAVVDSRDFLAARRRADNEVLMPPGPKIAFTGGIEYNDVSLIWDKLDKVLAKHPDMALLHGGAPKGAERIAARWADCRKIPQIAFKPDWTRYAKAAPFKRNDQMLDVLPIGVIAFPGTGIQDNFVDKARKLGIPGLASCEPRRIGAALPFARPNDGQAATPLLAKRAADRNCLPIAVNPSNGRRPNDCPGGRKFASDKSCRRRQMPMASLAHSSPRFDRQRSDHSAFGAPAARNSTIVRPPAPTRRSPPRSYWRGSLVRPRT